jgi:type IV pilus assembly protein PilA
MKTRKCMDSGKDSVGAILGDGRQIRQGPAKTGTENTDSKTDKRPTRTDFGTIPMSDTIKPGLPRPAKANAMGFSLIELLIVVAVILIIAAIAIPNFLHARMAANEASAVSSVRVINGSEVAYAAANPSIGYSVLLTDLGPASGDYIDATLAGGLKGGYAFTYLQGAGGPPATNYTLNADPTSRSITGQRSFYTDQTNVIHYNVSAVAGPSDLALQ